MTDGTTTGRQAGRHMVHAMVASYHRRQSIAQRPDVVRALPNTLAADASIYMCSALLVFWQAGRGMQAVPIGLRLWQHALRHRNKSGMYGTTATCASSPPSTTATAAQMYENWHLSLCQVLGWYYSVMHSAKCSQCRRYVPCSGGVSYSMQELRQRVCMASVEQSIAQDRCTGGPAGRSSYGCSCAHLRSHHSARRLLVHALEYGQRTYSRLLVAMGHAQCWHAQ